MGNSGEIKRLEPEYQGRLGQRHSFCYVKFGSSRFSSETDELKQEEPGYPRRPGDPGSPIAPSSAGSATPPSPMNLASSVTGEIKQLEPEYPRRPGDPGSRIAPSSAGSATPPPSMNLASSKAGEIKQLQPEYPRWPVQHDRFYYLRFESCSFNSDTVELKQLEPEYPRRPGDPVPDCTVGDSPIAPSSAGSATPPSSMYLASSKTGETKQLEPVYPQRPVQRDRFYYLRFDSCSFNSNTVEYPRRPGEPVPDCTIGDSPFAPSSAGSATPTSSMNLASSVTGKIKQLEPEYPRRAGEPVPDCMIGDSPFAPSSAGSATPPSSISVANSETGEIKQLEPEPDYTIGDSPIAFSSAGSAPPTSLMNLASSVSGEIKQLEPEYPRRPGKPDCPMSDASSLSSVSITTPPSENKRRIKKKSIVAPTGDPSSDVSAAPPANSETGEKQPEPEYPLRPGKSDCSYYVKFGSCRYGKNCWFNHPLYMRGGFQRENCVGKNSSRASNSSEYNKQYFSDKACNYNRHEGKTKVKQVKLNFLGLPLRPGAILCSYYMNRGTCKFGTNCKFHHPDPESEDANLNASHHTTQGISQTNSSTKHVQQALDGHSVPFVTSATIGTSEVIPTQGVNPCPEWNGYQMDENKQGKSDWDPFTTKVFCDICTDEVLAGNRPTGHLNGIGYKNLCTKFNEKTKKGYNHEQFKSKWESLKKDYQTWKALMDNEDDLGQGTKMNTISASLEWWAKKMEVMPDCGKFCFAPLENVNLLNIMFEDMVDLGSTTPGANSIVNTTIRSEQGAGDGNDVGIIDKYVNEQSKEAMLQQSSKKEPNLTKLKTNYVHAELNDLVNFDENLNPSNLATSMRIDRVGSNISEIMELVVGAGAEEGSDEHFIATQLFITPEHREMFLTLKTPRGRLGWLKKMCQVKDPTSSVADVYSLKLI